jgi:hypothetical protein
MLCSRSYPSYFTLSLLSMYYFCISVYTYIYSKPFCKLVFIMLILLTNRFLSRPFLLIYVIYRIFLDGYYITNNMSYDNEWPSRCPLKWFVKIIIDSVITLYIFTGIYMSVWIASVETNIYVLFILWVFICIILLTMLQVKRNINHEYIQSSLYNSNQNSQYKDSITSFILAINH